jgi:ribose-phosphate pyrophosphokinase
VKSTIQDTGARLVFATHTYNYMREAIARGIRAQVGEVERRNFPDGEHYQRLMSPVLGKHVVLVGGTASDAGTLELYDLASAIVKYGARSLSLVIPYFGYATMERATKPGEVVTAKTRARLLSSIPNGDAPNRILLFDVHTEGLPYYFEGSTVPVHVYGKSIVTEWVDRLGGARSNVVLACTDAGRAKWVESLANDMGVPASFVFKRRISGAQTEVSAVSAQVENKNVVIYDDMIRTGGSLLQAARAYLDAGAKEISAVATHGIFPGDSLLKIQQSGLLKHVACTDSLPRACELASDFLSVAPTAALFSSVLEEHLGAKS